MLENLKLKKEKPESSTSAKLGGSTAAIIDATTGLSSIKNLIIQVKNNNDGHIQTRHFTIHPAQNFYLRPKSPKSYTRVNYTPLGI